MTSRLALRALHAVLARGPRARVQQRGLRRAAVAAAAVAVALTLASIAAHEHGSARGDVFALRRERLDIGARVVAVLEPGARLSYDVDARLLRNERVDVVQRAGRVLYRGDAGATVHTPGGSVRCDDDCAVVIDVADARVTVDGMAGTARFAAERSRAIEVRDGDRVVIGDGPAAYDDASDERALLASIDDESEAVRSRLRATLAELRHRRAELATPSAP